MDLHIDDFYKDVAAGLLFLYDSFPRKVSLYVEDLIGYEPPDEYGLPSERHQSCLATFLWLAEEGFLRFESTIGYDAIDQAVITEKCFLKLSSRLPNDLLYKKPEADIPAAVVRQRLSFAQQLRDALAEQDAEQVIGLCRYLFG